jgi:septin family protein
VSNAIREAKLNETAKPVYFNVMIVGEENLGKSDFLDKFLSQVNQKLNQPTHRSTTPRKKLSIRIPTRSPNT